MYCMAFIWTLKCYFVQCVDATACFHVGGSNRPCTPPAVLEATIIIPHLIFKLHPVYKCVPLAQFIVNYTVQLSPPFGVLQYNVFLAPCLLTKTRRTTTIALGLCCNPVLS